MRVGSSIKFLEYQYLSMCNAMRIMDPDQRPLCFPLFLVSGGLLAQILSQDGDTPQKSPFPETPQSGRLASKR